MAMQYENITTREVIGMFFERLSQDVGVAWIPAVSMLFQSDQASEKYPWLGMAPMMREWIGGRHAKSIPEEIITIENLHFEATLEFQLDDLRRDKTTQVRTRINELADRANAHWASLLSTLIINGHTDASGLAYDGQYFFDTDHVTHLSGSQSNDTTVDISAIPVTNHGSTTAPSAGEMSSAIMTTIQNIVGFKDDQGQPMNELARNFTVMTPINLWQSSTAALANRNIDGGDDNTLVAVQADGFNITLAANPRLTATDTFFVFNSDGSTSALIRQEETGVLLKAKGEGSDFEFDTDAHQYGIDTHRNVGYGRWEKACRTQLV
jgi:phage major head subunit gpT-like protein